MRKALPALALLALSAPAMADDQFSLTSGFDYTTGTYGNTQSTQILYIPVTAKYESGDWTAKLTVPYIQVTGPGGVLQGFGRVAPSGSATTTTTTGPRFGRSSTGGTATNSGLGDIIASLGRTMIGGGEDDPFELDVVGKIKFGTADANAGLGTGKNDYSGQFDATYWLSDETSLLGTAGYKIVGEPVGFTVNNVYFGSAGVDHATSDATNIGVLFDYVQKITFYGYDQKDGMAYFSHKFSPTLKMMGYVLKGFSDGSPDRGIGATVTGFF
jgi:hypothetical protein